MKKLGQQLELALTGDVPSELLASILTTSHPGRLQKLFQEASLRLLASHQAVQQSPGVLAALQARSRHKLLLDLIRARMASVGCRKPAIDKLFALMDTKLTGNVIAIRKAA